MNFMELGEVSADNPMFITSAMSDGLNWDFANAIGIAAPVTLEWDDTQAVTDWYGAYCGV